MSTFSRVVSRPTNKEQLKPFAFTKPTFTTTTHTGRGIWQPSYADRITPQLYKPFVGGDFHTDTLFNPVWSQGVYADSLMQTRPTGVSVPPNTAYGTTPSPPSLPQDDSSTEYSFLSSSSPEADSPPPTAFSTIAVLGSPDMDGAFEDDYDRPEADPNFIRRLLRRSKSLRRQVRMRDGDFRDSDEEDDYSVTAEWIPVVRPEMPKRRVPTQGVPRQIAYDARSDTTPSRLSRRVRVPAPIDTSGLRVAIAAKILRDEYELEVGDVDGSELTSSSESGFDGDDEHDELRRAAQTPEDTAGSVASSCDRPKKSYAAVVASSPPRANTPQSRTLVPQAVHAAPMFGSKERDVAGGFEWQPFVEPLDV
ncbi:hypothetical protein BD309DRAFT_853623 [Dichomitus squalens]|uniref:Uncharacterized protein n=1 Tax=Dichomitus squalens TaxID=114155 RepID=A0A4Q9MSA1_9APHY|nr:hypothetical protein BD311DRAFT_787485 [Dichomitus squalens]TBU48571.1 hypothetical protein BD309DRAFT_853623 [Dichomitus squalens]